MSVRFTRAAVAGVLALTGCAGGGSGRAARDTSTPVHVEETTTSVTAPAEPVEVTPLPALRPAAPDRAGA